MKKNRKFLGIFLSLGFVLTFNLAVGAMENKNKENLETPEIPIEFIVMQKEDLKDRVELYCKIRYILEKFGVFDEKSKNDFLQYVCFEKMGSAAGLVKKNLNYISNKKPNDLEFKNKFRSAVMETFFDKTREKISSDLFNIAKRDIKEYLVDKISKMMQSIEEVKKEYEGIKEGKIKSKISESEYEFSIKDVTQASERYKKFLAGIESLTYDEFKD